MQVGICLKTSFEWRHKILAAIRALEGGISFSGIVEADELLMKYSEKGRKFKNKEEYRRAKKKKHPKVAVLVVTDREGNLLFKQVGEKKVKNERGISGEFHFSKLLIVSISLVWVFLE